MKIYIGHSKNFDFKTELYEPLKQSELASLHELIFPHETDQVINSKDIIKNCDLMIAEVSFPATGLGIELGWANCFERPIICIYKTGSKISGSLKVVSNTFIEYSNEAELVNKLKEVL
jgi:hypothetical protein